MPHKRALLVGNASFKDKSLRALMAPVDDVHEFRAVLERQDIAGFDVEVCMDVDLAEVHDAIVKLYDDNHPDDVVLFYYSGHGLRDSHGDRYLALTSTSSATPAARSIDCSFLLKMMNRSVSKRQVVILDCCHAGAFVPDRSELISINTELSSVITQRDFEPIGRGRYVLAATTSELSAFERNGVSVYTSSLIDGIKNGAAASDKREISIRDLHEYCVKKIKDVRASMKPQMWVDPRIEFELLMIARNPVFLDCPVQKISILFLENEERQSIARFRLLNEGNVGELFQILFSNAQDFNKTLARFCLSKSQNLSNSTVNVYDKIRENIISRAESKIIHDELRMRIDLLFQEIWLKNSLEVGIARWCFRRVWDNGLRDACYSVVTNTMNAVLIRRGSMDSELPNIDELSIEIIREVVVHLVVSQSHLFSVFGIATILAEQESLKVTGARPRYDEWTNITEKVISRLRNTDSLFQVRSYKTIKFDHGNFEKCHEMFYLTGRMPGLLRFITPGMNITHDLKRRLSFDK